jgi:hypothetical protein
MEARDSVETLLKNYEATWNHIPVDALKKKTADSFELSVRHKQVARCRIQNNSNIRSLLCSQQLVFLNRTNADHTHSLRSLRACVHVLARTDLARNQRCVTASLTSSSQGTLHGSICLTAA